MDDDDLLLVQIEALQSSVEMVNSLMEQNRELITALERIVSAKYWIGRDYKLFAEGILLKMKEKRNG
jgi:prefoldin subunit 5